MELILSASDFDFTHEEQLISGCLRGDRLCQRELYDMNYRRMMAVCMRYANDYEEARDILNEGFMKVFTNLHNYQPTHPLPVWIKRIIVNTAIDHYRRNRKNSPQVELDYAHTECDTNTETIIDKLSAEEIMSVVQQLSPAYRTVFNLYVVEGYSHREIADLLGIGEGTSKSNLSKAKLKLQELICENFPDFYYKKTGNWFSEITNTQ